MEIVVTLEHIDRFKKLYNQNRYCFLGIYVTVILQYIHFYVGISNSYTSLPSKLDIKSPLCHARPWALRSVGR